MEDLNWIYLLYLLTGIPALVMLTRISYKDKSLSAAFFGGALFSLLFSITLSWIWPQIEDLTREWGDLIAITLALCGILSEIRNSKPVFVRFPIYLTGLPLIGILFYPLIIDVDAVEDLLIMTYETGALIVSLLIVSINHYLYKGRGLLILGVVLFTVAYVLFWFFGFIHEMELTAKILFATGMIVCSVGFYKANERTKQQRINTL